MPGFCYLGIFLYHSSVKVSNMDKDKIIVIVYVGTCRYNDATALEYLRAVSDRFYSAFDDSVKALVIPRGDTDETWVECINPQLVSEEKYKEAEETVEKIKKILEEENNENV